MPEWSKGAVSKTVVAVKVTVGSNPTLSAIMRTRRDDRVAEGARLEIVCSAKRYRGFESLSLRQFEVGQ